jgi:hypothetical protein
VAESFVQVNIPATLGKKLATYEYVNGSAEVVESEAVTLTDSAGAEVHPNLEATQVAILGMATAIAAKIRPPAGNSTLTPIAAAIAPTPFLPADPTRLGFSIYNQSTSDTLYLLLAAGGPVSTTVFSVALIPGAYYEDAFGYTGVVSGIWDVAGIGTQALVTDYTP